MAYDMNDIATLAGYAGTVTGVLFMLPQVYLTYRTKSVEDISWGMLGLFLLNCIFWLTYGTLTSAAPVAVTNAIALVITTVQITMKILYRNNP